MAVDRAAWLLKVAVFVEGALQLHDYDPEQIYEFDDLKAHVWLGSNRKPKDIDLARNTSGGFDRTAHPPAELVNRDGTLSWLAWCPAETGGKLAEDRQFGYREFKTSRPSECRVRTFFRPRRLISSRELQDICADIASEFPGVDIRDSTESDVRTSLIRRGATVAFALRLSAECVSEARVVQLMRLAPARYGLDEEGAESELLRTWFAKRVSELSKLARGLSDHLQTVRGELGVVRQEVRKREVEATVRNAEEARRAVEDALRTVRRLHVGSDRSPLPFSMTPTMQRSTGFRQLLAALAEPPSWPVVERDALAGRALLKAPRLYELWCAVHIVRAFEAAGWMVKSRDLSAGGAHGLGDAVSRCQWRLVRGNDALTIDFNTMPFVPSSVPTISERRVPALEFAARAATQTPCWVAPTMRTPDFLLRLESEGKRALAVGDASLADPSPGRQEGEKLLKVERYGAELGWVADGVLYKIAPLARFVAVPWVEDGAWDSMERKNAWVDCFTVPMSPRRTKVDLLIERLVSEMRNGLV